MITTRKKGVWELSLTVSSRSAGVSEILREVLISTGIPTQEISESSRNSRISISTYPSSFLQGRRLIQEIRRARLKGVRVTLKNLQPKDWQERWKLNLQPFALTRHLDIVPVWKKKAYRPNRRHPILIDTIMAFGTGQHETTRLMVELIEERVPVCKSFFDVGTGTGILAVIAAYYGAEEIYAIDIDPECLEVARRNMAVNGFTFDYLRSSDLKNLKLRKEFDFVAANLITLKLIEFKKELVRFVRPQGLLAVSGIALENLSELKREFKKLSLKCVQIKKGKEWAAVLYRRIK